MSIPISQSSLLCIIPTILLLLILVAPIYGFESRKLDETGLPGSSDPSIKCGGCSPCGHPSCYTSPPPPSPPPPPPKKQPISANCPPPPYNPGAGFVYMTAPPGELYPVDPYYSGSSRILAGAMTTVLGLGLLFLWL